MQNLLSPFETLLKEEEKKEKKNGRKSYTRQQRKRRLKRPQSGPAALYHLLLLAGLAALVARASLCTCARLVASETDNPCRGLQTSPAYGVFVSTCSISSFLLCRASLLNQISLFLLVSALGSICFVLPVHLRCF